MGTFLTSFDNVPGFPLTKPVSLRQYFRRIPPRNVIVIARWRSLFAISAIGIVARATLRRKIP